MKNTIVLTGNTRVPGVNYTVSLTSEAAAAAKRITAMTGRTMRQAISELIIRAEPLVRVSYDCEEEAACACENCPYRPEGETT